MSNNYSITKGESTCFISYSYNKPYSLISNMSFSHLILIPSKLIHISKLNPLYPLLFSIQYLNSDNLLPIKVILISILHHNKYRNLRISLTFHVNYKSKHLNYINFISFPNNNSTFYLYYHINPNLHKFYK